MTVFTVDACWHGGWYGGKSGRTTLVGDGDGFRLARHGDPTPDGHLPGTVLPGFHDAHVHLGLIDGTQLLDAGIASVDDFGWELDAASTWPKARGLPEVAIAGQLLTAPGGYPTASGWAPLGASCEIAAPDEAGPAVDRQLAAGAGFIKVTLNADVGPVLDDDTLSAIVAHAHGKGVTVAAHAQGSGQAERAFAAGVDRLAHAPWSERLPDELVTAMAATMSWVSTLDIHGWGRFTSDFAVATDNVRRFHAAGGDIRYGTDLGNGPLPLGINHRELLALEHAGLDRDALIAAITPPRSAARFGRHLSHIRPMTDESPAAWLASAHLIDPHHVTEYLT